MTHVPDSPRIPFFGARKFAAGLAAELQELRGRCLSAEEQLRRTGGMDIIQMEARKVELAQAIAKAQRALDAVRAKSEEARKAIVETEDLAMLQEAGVYHYRHPLDDAVAYQGRLVEIEAEVKEMTRRDGGAVLATTDWSVNGSKSEGKKMVRDFSKLMLRAFNAEADNLIRTLKPYKLDRAVERLIKVSQTIEKLGSTMHIRISEPYLRLRIKELELTADFLQKEAEEMEAERQERERLREERKVQAEIEREREKLEKERQHHENALAALIANGDAEGVARIREQLDEVEKELREVDFRAANVRAGYVYVISNIGSFGETMVKIGMTRRLAPMDRIKELSDASVPFDFDVHALFFSKDAVGIEGALHERLTATRVNLVNRRREFFRARPSDVKTHLAELAGELLQFHETADALEYRQCMRMADGRTT
jgi:hypothetical protein